MSLRSTCPFCSAPWARDHRCNWPARSEIPLDREALVRLGYDYSIPLFGRLKSGGEPRLLGTGSLLQCGDRWFLTTARHVLVDCFAPHEQRAFEANTNDTDVLVPINGGSIPVGGAIQHAPDDDVAVIAIASDIAQRLRERWRPITLDMVEARSVAVWSGTCFVVGFPLATMAFRDRPDIGMKFLVGLPFAYLGTWDAAVLARADTEPKHIEVDPDRAVLLPLDTNLIEEAQGIVLQHPDLGGISGSPIWLMSEQDGVARPMLAAIETSVVRGGRSNYIKGTRWWVVRELIRLHDPGLLAAAERIIH